MTTFKIIDDALPRQEFDNIKKAIFNNNHFPWYFYNHVNTPGDSHFQFIHIFFGAFKNNSSAADLMLPIYKMLNARAVLRAKANLLTRTEKIVEHGFHMDHVYEDDTPVECKNAVLYLNTNNGYTVFKKGKKKVFSKENRLLMFDNTEMHSGSSCTDEDTRVVININYV